ncbi:DUF6397 family protein [Streptomyces sp. NPDC035033]|uniref:DUF6397 family protein n=1 Tax=Streptomyces sp. NPDC035033 TaxID=3155368 RepID=UPI0033F7F1EF
MTVDETTRTVAPARAAEELGLKREEFRLAVRMGLIRTAPAPDPEGAAPDPGGGRDGGRGRAPERRPVERAELDRLRAAPDFPRGLRDRVRTVGAGEAAALLSVTHDRFTRLARTGHLSPVRFYLNRYRTVIWLYVAAEVAAFGEERPELLTGRMPAGLRQRIAAGEDLRARNWRSRHLGLLLRGTDDPWARAAAIASLLDPDRLAETVGDPRERARLDRLWPPPPPGLPVGGAAREVADRLVHADEPDEIQWYRASLALALDEARAAHPVAEGLPATEAVPTPPPLSPLSAPARPTRPRSRPTRPPGRAASRTRAPGLLARLRRSLPGRAAAGGWGERRDWG